MPYLNLDGSAQVVLTSINAVAALTVLWTAICTLNFMSSRTPLINRIAYVFLGVGAASMLLGPIYFDHRPGLGGTLMAIGVAVLLVTERIYSRRLLDRFADKTGSPRRPWWE